jgi:hypothetical protein
MTTTTPHRLPNLPAAAPSLPPGTTCPACQRPEALRVTRTETGRLYRCRFAERGECSFGGFERPFRRAPVERTTAAFAERLGRIAERVVDDCETSGEAVARVDPAMVTALRAAVRRSARERGIQVRTAHVGDGRVEIRVV